MLSIALTGNFGMGKTTVLKLFGKLGVYIFNIDNYVHEILDKPEYISMIADVLGDNVLNKTPGSNSLDKKRIADIIFNNSKKRKLIEEIIHPEVFRKIKADESKINDKNSSAIVMFEVPLLFECGYENNFDRTIVVYCKRDSTVRRLIKKGFSKEQITKRLRAQMPITFKTRMADFSINNSNSLMETGLQVERIFGRILKDRTPSIS
ncbi:MAG: dephospho-CoA kinase [Nitrospirota bacterium]